MKRLRRAAFGLAVTFSLWATVFWLIWYIAIIIRVFT